MGSFLKRKISPDKQGLGQEASSLLDWNGVVSRANFKFSHIVDTYGIDDQSVLWLASNINNNSQQYFVRQISKFKIYDHKKLEPTLNELHLLSRNNSKYIIKVNFAFQDYENLYLVSDAIQSESLEQVMKHHQFTQNQTRYIVYALLSIIQDVHKEGFAITDLSPKQIHIDKVNGTLKLLRLSNPTQIDSYCSSNVVEEVCPYSAPEILFRDKVLAECDFYSLGLIVYELMTQTKVFSNTSDTQKKNTRSDILKENIEVEKYKIPEDWSPEVADFLIKLLIKNPALRLGRYGSGQGTSSLKIVKSHPWLKEFDEKEAEQKKIKLGLRDMNHFKRGKEVRIEEKNSNFKEECINNHFFQQLFEKYKFQRKDVECEIIQQKEGSSKFDIYQRSQIEFNESNIDLKKTHM